MCFLFQKSIKFCCGTTIDHMSIFILISNLCLYLMLYLSFFLQSV
jgi:hypothetical protein